MAHGILRGIKHMVVHGKKHGALTLGVGTFSVTIDTTSGIYCPANATEWAQVMTAAGIATAGPSLLWLCQDPSGNLSDSIDTMTGTVTGTPITYQQPAAGWSRLGIVGSDGGTGVSTTVSASLPDPASASTLVLQYSNISSATAIRNLMAIGSGTLTSSRISAAGKLQAVSGGSVTTGTANPLGAIRPYITQYDFTNNRVAVFSDQEKLVVARAATTGKKIQLFFDIPGITNYFAVFTGLAAELTDAQIKSLLQILNWVIPWS